MATPKPRARKQRIRREQVREAQRRRRERLRNQHQRFLQLLVPEDLHQMLSKIATDLEVSVQQLALDLIRKALGAQGDDLERALEPIRATAPETVVPEPAQEGPKRLTIPTEKPPVEPAEEEVTKDTAPEEIPPAEDSADGQEQLSLF